jgi:regulator of nucleoside diphosphate kinase
MNHASKRRPKPKIQMSKTDHTRLSALARMIAETNPDLSDELFNELERAKVVADGAVPVDTVQMGSTVSFTADTGETRTVTLVPPNEADISRNRISILTPIGTALIGLSTGQSMHWTTRDGHRQELSILSVSQSSADANASDAQLRAG